MKRRITGFLLFLFIGIPTTSALTMIRAMGSVTSVSCGQGLHTFTGSHRADLLSLDPSHENRNWNVSGTLLKCGFLIDYPLSAVCLSSGNTSTTKVLQCQTQTDYLCRNASIKASTVSIVVNAEATRDRHTTTCYQPTNCLDPALAEETWLVEEEQ